MRKITLMWTFVFLTIQAFGGQNAAPNHKELSSENAFYAAPVSGSSISGVVKNGTSVVSGATVQLILPYTDSSHPYQSLTTTTDSQGAYSFSEGTLSGYNVIQSIKLNSWQNSGTNYFPNNINNIAIDGSTFVYNFNTQKSAPAVNITSPAVDVSTNSGGSIALSATINLDLNDGFTTLTGVTFTVDGNTVASSNNADVYTGSWAVSPSDFDIQHTFSVTAQSSNGESVTENFNFTLHTNYDVTLSFKDSDDNVISSVVAQWRDSFGGVLEQSVANASGQVFFADVLPYETYSFTYSLDGYSFLPSTYNLAAGNLNSDMMIDVLGSNQQLSISGTITEGGAPLENVVVTLKNASDEVLTIYNSVNGDFNFTGVIPGYDYTVVASKSYYTLTSLNYSSLTSSVNNASITGTRNTHTISGNITTYGNPLQGVNVTVNGNGTQYNATTDSSGDYQIASVLAGYNYNVVPSLTGYIFLPTNQSISLLNEDKLYDFAEDTRAIYGTVKDGSVPVSGASVELELQYQDNSHPYQKINAISDSEGNYSFDRNQVDGYNQFNALQLHTYQNGGTNYYPSSISATSLNNGQLMYDFNKQTSIPIISFTNPLISATAESGGSVSLEANVALNYNDGTSSLSNVSFEINGSSIASSNTANAYSASWMVADTDFDEEHIFKITASTTNGLSVSDSIFFSLYQVGNESDVFYIAETGDPNGDATTEATAATRISNILPSVDAGDEIRLLSGTIEESIDVTIPTGVQVVLESGVTMDMGTNHFNNNGHIVLETEANFIQGQGSVLSGTGDFEVIRETTANAQEYNYISSPITNTDIANTLTSSYVVRYNPSTAVTLNDGWEFITSGQMELGRGYAVSGKTGSNSSDRRFFAGTPNNGDVSIVIDGVTYGGEGDQWNMVGNPYPSSIDMQRFLSENSGIGAIYVYNQANDTYSTHNILSDPGGVTIASGQAFFIHASQASQTINFSNSMRIRENANIVRAASVDGTTLHLYKDGEEQFSTRVAFHNEATDAYDIKFDAPLLPGSSKAMIYSLHNNQPMAIQALGKNNEDKSIQLGLDSKAGTYRIQAKGTSLPYLIDKELNVIHNLAEGDYTFDFMEDSTNETRFELWYPELQTEDQLMFANFRDGYLQVRNYTDDSVEQVNVYDTMGKQIASWSMNTLTNQQEFELHMDQLSSAIYIIELKTASFSKVVKTSVVRN